MARKKRKQQTEEPKVQKQSAKEKLAEAQRPKERILPFALRRFYFGGGHGVVS